MPRRDVELRNKYQRDYRAKRSSGKPSGRPPLEDRTHFLAVRIPSSLNGHLNRVYDEGAQNGRRRIWPSRSRMVTDLLRRGLEAVAAEGDENLQEELIGMRAAQGIEVVTRQRTEAKALFSRLERELTELLAIKAEATAANMYWRAVSYFREMAETDWRNWFLNEAKTKFPELHRMPLPKVSLDIEEHEAPPERKPLHRVNGNGKVLPHTTKH